MLWRRASRSRLQPDQIKDSNAVATTGSGSWPKARVPFCCRRGRLNWRPLSFFRSQPRCRLFISIGADVNRFGCRKEALDKIMLAELRRIAEEGGNDPSDVALSRWTLHDLRRTARTLLSQAGVPPDHAEACLGHVVKGVEGIYTANALHDRAKYPTPKRGYCSDKARHGRQAVP